MGGWAGCWAFVCEFNVRRLGGVRCGRAWSPTGQAPNQQPMRKPGCRPLFLFCRPLLGLVLHRMLLCAHHTLPRTYPSKVGGERSEPCIALHRIIGIQLAKGLDQVVHLHS